jgi:N-acetylglutamate synthase-like GNAT family acetyltransferase
MDQHFTLLNEQFLISDNKSLFDVKSIHNYLCNESYWCKGIPLETVKRSIDNSLCVGVIYKNQTIGFARIISDFSTFAYLCDVFVVNEFQGKGISKRMMNFIMHHPNLIGLRRWMLMTKDAHGLYKQFGWQQLASPDKAMEINFPDIYQID